MEAQQSSVRNKPSTSWCPGFHTAFCAWSIRSLKVNCKSAGTFGFGGQRSYEERKNRDDDNGSNGKGEETTGLPASYIQGKDMCIMKAKID